MTITLRAVWGFLSGPMGRWAILAAVVALVVWGAYNRGVTVNEAKWAARLAESEARARKVEVKREIVTRDVERVVVQKQTEIKWQTKFLTKEIETRVPTDPSRANLPWGLVRLHDAASGLPDPANAPSEPDSAPSPFTDPDLARVVIENYGACRSDQTALRAWQDWYRQASHVR